MSLSESAIGFLSGLEIGRELCASSPSKPLFSPSPLCSGPMELSANGETAMLAGPLHARCSPCTPRHTRLCLNICRLKHPVEPCSVGEHICETKQCCGLPGGLWLSRWIIHYFAVVYMPGHPCSQQRMKHYLLSTFGFSLLGGCSPTPVALSGFNKTLHSFRLPLGSSFLHLQRYGNNRGKARGVVNCSS